MNILFIHGNFPGQFMEIAPALASRVGTKTFFLTLSENPQNISLDGVTVRRFMLHRDSDPNIHAYLQAAEVAVLKGQAVVRALERLYQDDGFRPDVVICHGGMGFGLYVKAVLPQVRLISYQEWYFTASNSFALLNNPSFNDYLKLETRNVPLLQEMVQADCIVCPTEYQRQQFPAIFRDRIRVIFDGVDVKFFSPKAHVGDLVIRQSNGEYLSFKPDEMLLTYGTRGMEPLRGFPEFMRAAAAAQKEFPHLQVIIFGKDRVAYSYESPHESGSWKQYMLEELADQLDLSRLHFPGLICYRDMVNLFRRSNLHCYFTRPFVVSWGLFQAISSGTNLLINNFAGVEDVFSVMPGLPAINLDDQEQVNSGVLYGLSNNSLKKGEISSSIELEGCLKQWSRLVYDLCSN